MRDDLRRGGGGRGRRARPLLARPKGGDAGETPPVRRSMFGGWIVGGRGMTPRSLRVVSRPLASARAAVRSARWGDDDQTADVGTTTLARRGGAERRALVPQTLRQHRDWPASPRRARARGCARRRCPSGDVLDGEGTFFHRLPSVNAASPTGQACKKTARVTRADEGQLELAQHAVERGRRPLAAVARRLGERHLQVAPTPQHLVGRKGASDACAGARRVATAGPGGSPRRRPLSALRGASESTSPPLLQSPSLVCPCSTPRHRSPPRRSAHHHPRLSQSKHTKHPPVN